jgi:hypothetical protein
MSVVAVVGHSGPTDFCHLHNEVDLRTVNPDCCRRVTQLAALILVTFTTQFSFLPPIIVSSRLSVSTDSYRWRLSA